MEHVVSGIRRELLLTATCEAGRGFEFSKSEMAFTACKAFRRSKGLTRRVFGDQELTLFVGVFLWRVLVEGIHRGYLWRVFGVYSERAFVRMFGRYSASVWRGDRRRFQGKVSRY